MTERYKVIFEGRTAKIKNMNNLNRKRKEIRMPFSNEIQKMNEFLQDLASSQGLGKGGPQLKRVI